MGPLLVFFLYILQLQASIRSEIIETPNANLNTISESEDDDLNRSKPKARHITTTVDPLDLPFVKAGYDQTEIEFLYPIASLNIDYAKNLITLTFRKTKADEKEARRRKSLDENFMRFGRDSPDFMRFGRKPSDFMRFGKRTLEQVPKVNSLDNEYIYDNDADTSRRIERSQEAIRDSRGDNFMRFGRNSNDFLRFGRASEDFMRFGRNPSDFMRLGRGGSDDFMRFGRTQKERRGSDKDFMRFGRPDNFLRFGRSYNTPTASPNFIRFGKLDQNFMRFGKNLDHPVKENSTKPPLPKEVIKEAAKILHQAERFGGEGESNPMDRAIKVLFGKDERHETSAQDDKDEQNNEDASNDDMAPDYEFNVTQ
ncbi:FMRFamide neuropeptides [Anastrepha obliqua]|uniref:FMRFamide neuropeptides n=1 Tax=Anastrepha obliqua TaxID=95512 RepID=UPI00240962B2|nr:FMRFamide neuropeptides [Anastrepha obliqua]